MPLNEWLYDELHHAGTDYDDESEVRGYDGRMSLIRDTRVETGEILDFLDLRPDEVLVEFGPGTGAFAIAAAALCRRVIAVDISQAMLDYAEARAREQGIGNIEFVRGGFLTWEPGAVAPGSVVSQIALHHLPDFWKQIALVRIAGMLPPGGRLFLRDLVYTLPLERWERALDYTVREIGEKGGDAIRFNYLRHIRAEYSTFDWIMEEMLYRAGFDILDARYGDSLMASYHCVKRKEGK